MYEGAAKLYRVLDEKRGMKKKKTGTLQTVILVGAVAEFVQEHVLYHLIPAQESCLAFWLCW